MVNVIKTFCAHFKINRFNSHSLNSFTAYATNRTGVAKKIDNEQKTMNKCMQADKIRSESSVFKQ